MPFTGAHPLAVLPLVHLRRLLRLDGTALVVGAMAPDLQYFARGYMSGDKLGHTWLGLALWSLPCTLVVAFLWHAVLKWPLVMVAPRRLAARLIPHAARPWPAAVTVGAVLGVAASAIIGAASHLLWDACTHADGFVVVRVPALAATIAGQPVHRLLQLGCSVIGLAGLALYLWRALARTPPVPVPAVPKTGARVAFVVAMLAGATALTARLFAIGRLRGGDLMVAPASGALVGLLVVALVLRARARRFAAREMLDLRA